MTAQLKRRSLIFGAGLLLYLCALGVSSQVELSDAVRFVWFLIAYLIIGFDSFRGLRDRFMKKQFLTEYTPVSYTHLSARWDCIFCISSASTEDCGGMRPGCLAAPWPA